MDSQAVEDWNHVFSFSRHAHCGGREGGRGEERERGGGKGERERVGVDITKSKMSNQPSFVALCTYKRKGLGSPH